MDLLKQKKIIILIIFGGLFFSSCRAKKKTFNGTTTLDCADYDGLNKQEKDKKTKWRLVLYKDGDRVLGKSKRVERDEICVFEQILFG